MALGGRRGAVVALDPSTGEVLAMVSQPSFDPNLFVEPGGYSPRSTRLNNGRSMESRNSA